MNSKLYKQYHISFDPCWALLNWFNFLTEFIIARAGDVESYQLQSYRFKGIASRDFGILFLFHWIDMKFVLGPDQVYFSFK
jgi:hypothetical protein